MAIYFTILVIMRNLNVYIEKLSQKQKRVIGNIAALFGDVLIIFYFSRIIDKFVTKNLVFMQLKLMGYQNPTLSQSDFLQFKALVTSNAKLLLVGIIMFHGIIYICGCLDKKWAISYVKRYAIAGVVLSAIEFAFYVKSGLGLNPFTLMTMILYGVSYLMLKAYVQENRKKRRTEKG